MRQRWAWTGNYTLVDLSVGSVIRSLLETACLIYFRSASRDSAFLSKAEVTSYRTDCVFVAPSHAPTN